MPQTAPPDTAAAAVESPRRGDFKRSVALAALGGVVAVVVAVVALGGGDGERVDRPTVQAASEPTWRHGESTLPAAWLVPDRREAPRPSRTVETPVPSAPAPVTAAPVVSAPTAPVPAAPTLPQPAQPGEDFTWQR